MKIELSPKIIASWLNGAVAALKRLAEKHSPKQPQAAPPPRAEEHLLSVLFHFGHHSVVRYENIRTLSRVILGNGPHTYLAEVSSGTASWPKESPGVCFLFHLAGRRGSLIEVGYYWDPTYGCARLIEQQKSPFEDPLEAEGAALLLADFVRAIPDEMELATPA